MAFFSNGEEGEIFEENFCATCANYQEDDIGCTCPILVLHLLWNDEQHDDQAKHTALSHFITDEYQDGKRWWTCSMYCEDPEKAREAERRRAERHPWMKARGGNGDE